MYYRRKILLALIEVFGGSLQNTDCEKLLFNFCQQTGKNHYDFFPHKYGPFSAVSYYDKQRLIDLGLLKPVKDFQLNTRVLCKKSIFNNQQPEGNLVEGIAGLPKSAG
ncbi:MAG: hypothetical protein ACOYY3_02060 [Chloroflexota bacterium]